MTNEQFLINFTPQETRVALLQQGVVQELHIERTNGRGIVGNVYLGRVVRVLPGMQSAFIEIGLERTAFLHVADIWSERPAGNGHANHETRPIEPAYHAAGWPLGVRATTIWLPPSSLASTTA